MRIEDANEEDTVKYIFKDSLSSNIYGKVEIFSGELFVKDSMLVENEWVEDLAPRFSKKRLQP